MECCSIPDCDNPVKVKARKLCGMHYTRWQRYGNPGQADRLRNKPVDWGQKHCAHSQCGKVFTARSGRQRFCSWDCRCREQGTLGRFCTVEGCDKPAKTRKYCGMHHGRLMKKGEVGPAGRLPHHPRAGQAWRNNQGYLVVHRDGRDILEHRYLFEQVLGRPLLATETVHHCNNQPDDNRTDGPVDAEFRSGNLQLWSGSQPPGGRVVDLVAWAVELLELYAPELLAQKPVQLRLAT